MIQGLRFRAGQADDVLDLVCFIDSASRGLALWFWGQITQPGESVIEAGRSRTRDNLESPLHYTTWTIAEINGAVAGALTGRLIPIPYLRGDMHDLPAPFVPILELEAVAAGSWYVNAVAIHPEFRGRGVGSALLGEARRLALSEGAPEMSIIVEDANAGAVRLYHRHHFVEYARRPFVPFPGSTDEGDWLLLKQAITEQA